MTAALEAPVSTRKGNTLAHDLQVAFALAVGLTAASYLVGLSMHWIDKLDWLEVFAVFTSYACTWLCVVQRRINYPIGALSTASYVVLFWRADLVSSAVLNLYLTPTLIYGWIRWRADEDTRPVTTVRLAWWPVYALVAVAGYLGAVAIATALDASLAWTDAVILTGTILAQFLMDNKKLENWIVWTIVNVFAIYTYATSDLPLVAFQYVFFLGNGLVALWRWNRERELAVAAGHTCYCAEHQGAACTHDCDEP